MSAPATAPQAAAAPAAAANPSAAGAAPSHAAGSLYVGDLAPDVTEAALFEIFNTVGPVSSIRVCRDSSTRVSLGYAYVNFHSVVDAERALDTLNFTPVKGFPCRIMWSRRDPSSRKNAKANIFIKNLEKSVDNKALYDTFSVYGNILSCKVALDAAMQSKGYAFVHYETEEAAEEAIRNVNGMLLLEKKVYVGKFERKTERPESGNKFTNVYIKNIPEDWTEEKLVEEFSKFGKITSSHLRMDPATGKHKGFGFCNYDTFEEAQRAKEEGCIQFPGTDKALFVDRFQKKPERLALLSKRYNEMQRERTEQNRSVNLFVKNLDDDVTTEKLESLFSEFGEISSAVVMMDGNVSKCFGFVCFRNPEDATKALSEMNNKMVGEKPIYVNRAQRKDDRKLQLESQFSASMVGRAQPMQPMFYSHHPPSMLGQANFMYHQPMLGGRRPAYGQPMRGGYASGAYPQPSRLQGGGRGAGPANRGSHQSKPRFSGTRREMMPAVTAPVQQQQQQQPQPSSELLQSLSNAQPEIQKQLLGEKLFPLIQKEQPQYAGKITGMLLEMDVAEILALLDSTSELNSKIGEAMEVLGA